MNDVGRAASAYTTAPTLELAAWISGLKYDDIPARTREVVRIAILDTLGCGIYGFGTPWAGMMLQWARAGSSGKGDATVWGEKSPSLRVADAAMVNGSAAHAFELDDYHNAKLHAGAIAVPAALAMGEKLGSDGKAIITAIAAGYETMIRSSLASNPSATRLRGWHITGIYGPFAAAAACASLMKLNPEQTAWALGLAGTQGAGTWAFNADGTMSKRLHAGKAAHSGVLAAEPIARSGGSGVCIGCKTARRRDPSQIYEFADGGVLKAHSDNSDVTLLTRDLGRVWHTDKNSIKPYSCCGSAHAYIDAALAVRKKIGAPWNSQQRVKVGLSKVVDVQCGFDYAPGSSLNAQMSVRYVIAAALADGQVLPPQFTDERMGDPELVKLAAQLECEHDPKLDALYPAHFAGWVAAEKDGQWVRQDILNPTGSVDNPVDAAGVIEKIRGILPDSPVDAIAKVALNIESHSVRELLALAAQRNA